MSVLSCTHAIVFCHNNDGTFRMRINTCPSDAPMFSRPVPQETWNQSTLIASTTSETMAQEIARFAEGWIATNVPLLTPYPDLRFLATVLRQQFPTEAEVAEQDSPEELAERDAWQRGVEAAAASAL